MGNGKNMNLQRIFFGIWIYNLLCLGVAWLLLDPAPSSRVNNHAPIRLFLEGHFGIHLEVASGPFCLLVNSPWPLVFALCLFFFFLLGFSNSISSLGLSLVPTFGSEIY